MGNVRQDFANVRRDRDVARLEQRIPRAVRLRIVRGLPLRTSRAVRLGPVEIAADEDLLNGQKPSVRLTVPDTDAAVRTFDSLPGIENVQANGNTLIVVGVTTQAVMDHLLQHHVIPTEIVAQKGDLESLFMDVTSVN